MSELYSIPLACKEGVYSVFDFYQDADGEDAIFFDYDTQYQMLTYDIPVGQDWRGMTLYSVPEKDIFSDTARLLWGGRRASEDYGCAERSRNTFVYPL